MADPLSTRQWQTYRKAMLPLLGTICGICGQPVDTTLKGTHPDGPTIDHITPRTRGGHVYDRKNIQLAHQHCNSSKHNNQPTLNTSRHW